MDSLLSSLTTALQSIATMFVNLFKSLSDIFVDTSGSSPTLTFVGGVLIIGLGVMLIFMVLRWIISLVKGI